MAASLYDGRVTMKGMPHMLVKTLSLALLFLSLAGPVKAQTPRPVPPALGAAPVAVPQRAAPKSMPSVVDVPPFTVVGTALTLPLAVNVPAFDVTGTLLKLPLTVSVSAFDVTGSMLKLPLTVAVPAFAVTGTYKP